VTVTHADPLRRCPDWCTGNHPWGDLAVADRFHESRPVTLAAKWKQLDVDFETTITWSPYAGPEDCDASASTQMVAHVSMDKPSDVHAFADMLAGYTVRLREVAEELAGAQEDGRARLLEAGLNAAGQGGNTVRSEQPDVDWRTPGEATGRE